METTLTQKLARQRLLQSQKRALLDEYMPIKEELETLEDEIEQLEEELQKQDNVQTDARLDEIIKDLNDQALKQTEIEEFEIPQRQPKAWSHADDETDQDR
jgi:predicted  nucleic acid-binding Zn-ribbon protein